MAKYGRSHGLFLACFSTLTIKTAADNKPLKSFLLGSQSWGKYNIVWDV